MSRLSMHPRQCDTNVLLKVVARETMSVAYETTVLGAQAAGNHDEAWRSLISLPLITFTHDYFLYTYLGY